MAEWKNPTTGEIRNSSWNPGTTNGPSFQGDPSNSASWQQVHRPVHQNTDMPNPFAQHAYGTQGQFRLTPLQAKTHRFIFRAIIFSVALFLFLLFSGHLTANPQRGFYLTSLPVYYVNGVANYYSWDINLTSWLEMRHHHELDLNQNSVIRYGPLLGAAIYCRCETLKINGSIWWSIVSGAGTVELDGATKSKIGAKQVITHGRIDGTTELGETITNLGTLGSGNDITDGARHRAIEESARRHRKTAAPAP